jgi:hypothetical protein
MFAASPGVASSWCDTLQSIAQEDTALNERCAPEPSKGEGYGLAPPGGLTTRGGLEQEDHLRARAMGLCLIGTASLGAVR